MATQAWSSVTPHREWLVSAQGSGHLAQLGPPGCGLCGLIFTLALPLPHQVCGLSQHGDGSRWINSTRATLSA